MNHLRTFGLLACALVLTACGGGQPTAPPATAAATPTATAGLSAAPTAELPTAAPSTAATQVPSASLDPSLSDAGVVARVTITNDSRGGRDGTHDIIGVAADGSDCSLTFEGDEYIAIAWHSAAPNGQIHRFGVSVPADDVPDEDGATGGVADGAVSFDFKSESGFGTTYTGAAARDNEGSSTIDVTRVGTSVSFDFEGVTYDGVNFAGQLVCAEV